MLDGVDSFEVAALVFCRIVVFLLPDMHHLADGAWNTMCGRCMRNSEPVQAASQLDAWTSLKGIGWRWYISQYGGRGYPECPSCAAAPHDVDAEVKSAMKSPKRRQ